MSENSRRNHSSALKLTDFKVSSLEKSNFVKPYSVTFKQNGHQRVWDGLKSHNSVSCFIYNSDTDSAVFVRQFRPVVFVSKAVALFQNNNSNEPVELHNFDFSTGNTEDGFVYELCAGICDKKMTDQETAQEEVLEECGFKVDLQNVIKINSTVNGVGINGSIHTIFYTQVDESMRISDGGGNEHEHEYIEVCEIPVKDLKDFINNDDHKPASLLYATTWFIHEQYPKIIKK
jgi:UDP-sugar diphosphatase